MRTHLAGPWEMVLKMEGFQGPASEQCEGRIKKMVKERYSKIDGKFRALNDILKNDEDTWGTKSKSTKDFLNQKINDSQYKIYIKKSYKYLMKDCHEKPYISWTEYTSLPDNKDTEIGDEEIAKIARGAEIDDFQERRRLFRSKLRLCITLDAMRECSDLYKVGIGCSTLKVCGYLQKEQYYKIQKYLYDEQELKKNPEHIVPKMNKQARDKREILEKNF